MSVRRDQIVALARSWIGTPYRHQGSAKGAGSDCLGLIRGVWRDLHGLEPEDVPAYSLDWSEPQRDEALWRAARRHMVEKPAVRMVPGDVLLFRMRDGSVAKHMGILARGGAESSFIHAYSRHGVVESALSAPWFRRVVAVFEFP